MKNHSDFKPNRWEQLVRLRWVDDRLHLRHVDVAPFGSDRWLPVKKVQPSPDDSLFSKISRLAGVPSDGLARLQRCNSLELEREWRWYERPITDQQALRSALDEVEKRKRLLSELQASLSRPSSYALGSLTWAAACIYEDENYDREAPDLPPGGCGFNQFKDAIATFAERASKAADLLCPEKTKHPVGRPARGGFGKPIGPGCLTQFTFRLLWDIRSVGGRLRLDKNNKTGSLPKVLELLSLHLPPGFIPNAPSFSTLAKIHARAEKIAAADLLDKKLGAVDVDKSISGPLKFTHL